MQTKLFLTGLLLSVASFATVSASIDNAVYPRQASPSTSNTTITSSVKSSTPVSSSSSTETAKAADTTTSTPASSQTGSTTSSASTSTSSGAASQPTGAFKAAGAVAAGIVGIAAMI